MTETGSRSVKLEQKKWDFNKMKEVYEKFLTDDAQGLKGLYEKDRDDLFEQNLGGEDTIFHIAARNGRVKVLQALVEIVPQDRKQELLKKKNIYGNTILHEVAATCNTKAAKILIEEPLYSAGTSTNHEQVLADRNKSGETPLFRAAGRGNKEMVKYLARKIEKMGHPCDHLKRDDQLSILHNAVIGQYFDCALWLLKTYPQFATSKDKYGYTCLHLLASMPDAFRSSSPSMGIFSQAIYNCLPSNSCDEDETSNMKNTDLEQGQSIISKGPNQPKRSKENCMTINLHCPGFRLYCSLCECLAKGIGLQKINRIWEKKKMHESAVKLAKKLLEADNDASWLKHDEPKESDTTCLDRKGEEEGVKNSAASGAEKSHEPETPLFIAASTGILEIVEAILTTNPQAVVHRNKKGRNIIHVAILHRKYKVVNYVRERYGVAELVRQIDNQGRTILHHAADTKYNLGRTKTNRALTLREEFRWFKDVKNKLPSFFALHRNRENMTADQLFEKTHKELLESAQEWVKNTCQSSSTVAALVAGVVFAAAYAPPGDFERGRPVLIKDPLFLFFTVVDVTGLACSLTSLVIFLSIPSSSLEYDDFLHKIPWGLWIGFLFLFFSVISTMLTFTSTILLLVQVKMKTASLAYAASLVPVCLFGLVQFPLYFMHFLDGIRDLLETKLPGNWEGVGPKNQQISLSRVLNIFKT